MIIIIMLIQTQLCQWFICKIAIYRANIARRHISNSRIGLNVNVIIWHEYWWKLKKNTEPLILIVFFLPQLYILVFGPLIYNIITSDFIMINITYHRVCSKNIATCATSGTGTAYPSGAPEFAPGLNGIRVAQLFSFLCSILWIIVCPFSSYYLFCIFKLFVSANRKPIED
jgi:hypothetical protein